MLQSRAFRIGALALLLILAGALLTYNLDGYPVTWFDEGEFLQVPKNLVDYGKYAQKSSEGLREFDPSLTVGPTVLLPIAGVFELFGTGLAQARLVVALFAVAALVLLVKVVQLTDDWATALAAAVLLVFAPWSEFVHLGRQVLGEVASLAFMLLGIYFWLLSIRRASWIWSVACGLAFGFAILTKIQSGLVVGALILLGIANIAYYRSVGLRHWLLPLLLCLSPLIVWYGVEAAVIGPNEFLSRITSIGGTSGGTLFVGSFRRVLANVNLLGRMGFLWWGAAAFCFQGAITLSKKRSGIGDFFLLAIAGVWLGWYVVGSIGWTRYAFVGLALSSIFLARFIRDLTGGFDISIRGAGREIQQGFVGSATRNLTVFVLMVTLVSYGLVAKALAITENANQPVEQLVAFLDANVDTSDVIETWEWELPFQSDHNYHLPTFDVLAAKIDEVQLGVPYNGPSYDFMEFQPAFLIDGPFSKWTQLYASYGLQERCALTATFGIYDLYDCRGATQGDGASP